MPFKYSPMVRSTLIINVPLLDKLQATMYAILVPIHPALRMFFTAAFLDNTVRVYDFATHRAVADWGVVALVIQIWTKLPLHFGCLLLNWPIRTPAWLPDYLRSNISKTKCSVLACPLDLNPGADFG